MTIVAERWKGGISGWLLSAVVAALFTYLCCAWERGDPVHFELAMGLPFAAVILTLLAVMMRITFGVRPALLVAVIVGTICGRILYPLVQFLSEQLAGRASETQRTLMFCVQCLSGAAAGEVWRKSVQMNYENKKT